MSILSFLNSVGKKLTGGDIPTADELKKELDSHKLGTEGVKVTLDGDKAVLNGEVKDQAAYEKALLAVGNIHGIAGVNADGLKVAGESPAEGKFYTVQKGDTLWKIAEEQYGKGKGDKYSQIFEANKPMLDSPDKIYPGQNLRIPPLQ